MRVERADLPGRDQHRVLGIGDVFSRFRLRIVLQDGARWLAADWRGHGSYSWTYFTVALEAILPTGELDPSFANSDGVAPLAVKRARSRSRRTL